VLQSFLHDKPSALHLGTLRRPAACRIPKPRIVAGSKNFNLSYIRYASVPRTGNHLQRRYCALQLLKASWL